jgi:signal transduction histidine kinase
MGTVRNNLLFWKITGVFSLLLLVLATAYIGIAASMSRRNFNAINEQLYGDVAPHIANHTTPFRNGRPDTAVTHDIIHSIMIINPSVEIYLLDTTGRIVDYVLPDKTVKATAVDLQPVRQYLREGGANYVTGDNPKTPGRKSVFSAAPVQEDHRLVGYVYAILASEKQARVAAALDTDYIFGLGTILFFATLGVAFLVGVFTFFLITDSISQLASLVRRFRDGDFTMRIEGQMKGNLGLLSSAFNEMADTIVDNMDKLTSLDRLRQELIANVSHDLRSPLAITLGYVETLIIKGDALSEGDKQRYLAIITSSLRKLIRLVDQLFEYSKLEANQVQPNKEPFLLGELLSDILMKYGIVAQERGIRLQMENSDNLPAVYADLALVERAVQNLLDNALKFTPEGGTISIRLRSVQKGIEITIADTGVGIPPDDQPYIFDRYKKSPTLGIEQKEGMGLGLAIVKKILELHQATIHIRSIPGSGTTFWFQLSTVG